MRSKTLHGAVAVDCEMVGGRRGKRRRQRDFLARVSLVDEQGETVYDTFVKHGENVRITNYRTAVSGVTEAHLATGRPFTAVRKEVAELMRKRILVGHALDKDLKVLKLSHPQWNQRDTADYPPLQTAKGRPSLKKLAAEHLNISIQNGAHDSTEDARAAMMIYKKYEEQWNKLLSKKEIDKEFDEKLYAFMKEWLRTCVVKKNFDNEEYIEDDQRFDDEYHEDVFDNEEVDDVEYNDIIEYEEELNDNEENDDVYHDHEEFQEDYNDYDDYVEEYNDYEEYEEEYNNYDDNVVQYDDYEEYEQEYNDYEEYEQEYNDYEEFEEEYNDQDDIIEEYNDEEYEEAYNDYDDNVEEYDDYEDNIEEYDDYEDNIEEYYDYEDNIEEYYDYEDTIEEYNDYDDKYNEMIEILKMIMKKSNVINDYSDKEVGYLLYKLWCLLIKNGKGFKEFQVILNLFGDKYKNKYKEQYCHGI